MQPLKELPQALTRFGDLNDECLVDLTTASKILNRSRASLYRDAKAGTLNLLKVGCSTRVSVGGLRRLISGGQ